MKFGIITPVYDKCLESTELLYEDLKKQTHENWSWLLCSNGFSKVFSDFVESKNKLDKNKRLTYVSTKYVELNNNTFSIIANIGKRRNLCIQKIACEYLFMFDADAKILNRQMFETLNQELTRKPTKLCVYHIKNKSGTLPSFPINDGNIDLLNFCTRTDLAKKIGYPMTTDFFRPANDFNFFVKCYRESGGDAMVLNNVFCEYNGNSRYKHVRQIVVQMQGTKRSTTKQYLAYSLKHHPLGLFKAVKDYPFALSILPYKAVFARHEFYKTQPTIKQVCKNLN